MYERLVERLVEQVLEDESFIDFASLPLRGTHTTARILLKDEKAVVSGAELVSSVLTRFGLKSEFFYRDGELASEGTIAELEGDAYNLLVCERTILNVLGFMSGIATKTRDLVERLKSTGVKVRLAATRKTVPFAMELQKIAVLHGGADTHRLNLSEAAMIKDNHLALFGDVERAIGLVKEKLSFAKKLEVEAETPEQAFRAAQAGADIVMLDNMPVYEACRVAQELKKNYPSVLVEYSGGVDPKRIEEYACPYFDVISVGKLTTEVKFVDFSLEVSG